MLVLFDEIYLIKAAISTIFYLGICCQFTFKYYGTKMQIFMLNVADSTNFLPVNICIFFI